MSSILTIFYISNLYSSEYRYSHYANTPVQYTVLFYSCKNDDFRMKNCDIFLIFTRNIDCGYSLELPQ